MRYATVAAPRLPRTGDGSLVPAAIEGFAAVAAILMLTAVVLAPWFEQTNAPRGTQAAGSGAADGASAAWRPAGRETVVSGYVGAPYYYRSNVEIKRPNGTDLELKRLGWDGDALYFPIDGGVRAVRWSGSAGLMIDFLHNKAIARLGKGAHGRRIENGVIEDVETAGTLKGQPAPSPLRLTDLFDRLEFTHGHNVLLLTGLARLAPLTPRIRPYLGVGAGVAVPHVEVWFAGRECKEQDPRIPIRGTRGAARGRPRAARRPRLLLRRVQVHLGLAQRRAHWRPILVAQGSQIAVAAPLARGAVRGAHGDAGRPVAPACALAERASPEGGHFRDVSVVA